MWLYNGGWLWEKSPPPHQGDEPTSVPPVWAWPYQGKWVVRAPCNNAMKGAWFRLTSARTPCSRPAAERCEPAALAASHACVAAASCPASCRWPPSGMAAAPLPAPCARTTLPSAIQYKTSACDASCNTPRPTVSVYTTETVCVDLPDILGKKKMCFHLLTRHLWILRFPLFDLISVNSVFPSFDLIPVYSVFSSFYLISVNSVFPSFDLIPVNSVFPSFDLIPVNSAFPSFDVIYVNSVFPSFDLIPVNSVFSSFDLIPVNSVLCFHLLTWCRQDMKHWQAWWCRHNRKHRVTLRHRQEVKHRLTTYDVTWRHKSSETQTKGKTDWLSTWTRGKAQRDLGHKQEVKPRGT